MAKRAAQGAGTIRKRTVTRNGKQYTYWEGRVTTGRDPGTGRQVQRSFTGKTQKEVRENLQAAAVAVANGTYHKPEKMTVGQWLDTWAADYLGGAKPNTVRIYKSNIQLHIKPALGAVRLSDLRPHAVQRFVNGLQLSPASVRLAYKVFHMALERAVDLGYLQQNPAARCELPRLEQAEISPLSDAQTSALLQAADTSDIGPLIRTALFTGCRLGELLGLTWDCVVDGQILINKQLAIPKQRTAGLFLSPKNGKSRTLTPPPSALAALETQRRAQLALRLQNGLVWDNPQGLVFTTQTGGPLTPAQVQAAFHQVLKKAGLLGVRFHDLRHTYAVNAIRAGDDIKTVQGNLGHSSAAFTLDRYGHFTERMKQDSADRMETFIQRVLNL